MSSRYQELYRLPNKLYVECSPVLIEAGALQKDTAADKVLAQVKIRNLSTKNIIACKVAIKAYETNGNEVEGISEFAYLDVNISKGKEFGTKTPIYLPNNATRKFSVVITEVVFADGSIWTSDLTEWKSVPVQKKITEVLNNPEDIKQYKIEVGENCEFYPEKRNGLFFCTCGRINLETASSCSNCGKTYERLEDILHEEVLTWKRNERLKKEKYEKEEAERIATQKAEEARVRKENNKKRLKKILAIVIPIIIVIGIIAALTPGVIKPAIDNAIAYHRANELLEDGLFDDAKTAFDALGTYRDSENMSKESIYQKAKAYQASKQYDDATSTYELVSGYLDADDLAQEAQYQKAEDLCEQGKYKEAISVWNTIQTYSDSIERMEKAEIEWKEPNYQAAQQLMNEKNYKEAAKTFNSLGKYKDSVEKTQECNKLRKEADYQLALEYYEAKDYLKAITYFGFVPGYKDTNSLKIDAHYNYAGQLIEKKDYVYAIEHLEKCKDYKDAAKKINEAKYKYVIIHKDDTNILTEKYLDDLVKANYADAKSIYNQLYVWKIKVTAINSSENGTENCSSLKYYDKWYFHFEVSGGKPEGSEQFYYKIVHPNGSVGEKAPFSYPFDRGETSWIRTGWASPSSGDGLTGTCSIYFYDSRGNQVGSGSVKITK